MNPHGIETRLIDDEGVTRHVWHLHPDRIGEPLLTPIMERPRYSVMERDLAEPPNFRTQRWDLATVIDPYDGGPIAIYHPHHQP